MELAEIGSEIEARERLERITDGMVSAGTLEKNDRRQHLGRLERASKRSAEVEQEAAPVAKVDPVDTAAQLAAWGIGFGPE